MRPQRYSDTKLSLTIREKISEKSRIRWGCPASGRRRRRPPLPARAAGAVLLTAVQHHGHAGYLISGTQKNERRPQNCPRPPLIPKRTRLLIQILQIWLNKGDFVMGIFGCLIREGNHRREYVLDLLVLFDCLGFFDRLGLFGRLGYLSRFGFRSGFCRFYRFRSGLGFLFFRQQSSSSRERCHRGGRIRCSQRCILRSRHSCPRGRPPWKALPVG